MSELMASYRRASDGFGRRLALVTEAQWPDPTPCAGWTVRDLVAHVLDEQLWVPPLVEGETIDDVGDRFRGDQIGADAMAAWTRARSDVVRVLSLDGVDARTVLLSFGPASASDYVGQVTVDTLVHTWDLARAIGADEELHTDDVVAAIEAMAPQVEAFRAGGAFGPAVTVPADADPQTRLLAMLGRTA
jgi:uncharacterized protein (TIGR03086 family)